MIEWFTRNTTAANLLMALILALGFHALFSRLPVEVFIDIDFEVVNITMMLRGATPLEVEESIVVRIEEAISDLVGIERIVARANEGGAEIKVEAEKGYDVRALLDDIKNRIDAISTFPKDAERPIYRILQHRPQVISVVLFAELPERRLRVLGERIRDDLLDLPGISHVDIMGTRDYEIALEIDSATLERLGLGFEDIAVAVRAGSGDYPAGSLKTYREDILLRTEGQAYTGEEFGRISILARPDGVRLTLADIAGIEDGFVEDPLLARFNGRPAVLLPVYRTANQSAMELAHVVRDYVESARSAMPPGVSLDFWFDTSREIAIWLDILLVNALQGGLIIFLVLALFLRPSVAGLVFIGIPVSFMGALVLMPEFGASVNVITLFSFILVLGIVVDDAIVTGENIHTHLMRNEDSTLVAIRGTHEVAVPVTFGVLTTITAFASLLLVEGARGIIFGQIAVVVILVLAFSLLQSKCILPAHMRHLQAGTDSGIADTFTGNRWWAVLSGIQRRVAKLLERGVREFYLPLLTHALAHRFLTLSLFVGFSFVLLSFVFSGRYHFTFFPQVDGDVAWATLEMSAGVPDKTMERHLDHVEQAAHRLRERYRDPNTGLSVIRNILVERGWSFILGAVTTGSHQGEVLLELGPPNERPAEVTNAELIRQWRWETGPVPGTRELGFYFDKQQQIDPIDIRLSGEDFAQLAAAAAAVRKRLAEYPGVFDIRDNVDAGRDQIELTLRPEAELLGVSTADLGLQVRQAFFGIEVQRIQRDRDDVRVMLRYPADARRSLTDLARMKIRTPAGAEIPLPTVAAFTTGSGFSTILRIDRHRSIDVTADVDKENVDVNRIMADMAPFLADIESRWPGISHSLEGELREQRESFASLYVAVGLVFFVIYSLLAIPLRSYLQPFLIMGVIPFSVVGALLGHMIMGLSLSMMSVMGILALAGVVVNDSLLLVDYINRRRREGQDIMEAVRIAGAARFRAIWLTSLTTFAGLLPLIFEDSIQAQYLIPMAVSLGFGILYSTLLTLFFVPVGYTLLQGLRASHLAHHSRFSVERSTP
uniref:Multidrug efflux pump subunit AcrB n=1 Tax=Candidatus Kentrum sp. TUN TaxID=2126343 RepID=A0A451A3R4_9GAMM|nr:MAG: Multidrug efflux pump subunit AcrB [Candidatus Kentron sp. TUN]